MSKVMTKGCACNELDDDLKDEGWTCYACYEGDNEQRILRSEGRSMS